MLTSQKQQKFILWITLTEEDGFPNIYQYEDFNIGNKDSGYALYYEKVGALCYSACCIHKPIVFLGPWYSWVHGFLGSMVLLGLLHS